MLLAILVATIVAIVGVLRGGSLDSLASTSFRWVAVLLAGLVVQVAFGIWDPRWLSEAGGLAVLLGSHLTVVAFLIANRKLAGMAIAAAGLLLNMLVIGLNAGMPVSQTAAEIAGLEGIDASFDAGIKHERMTDDTTLAPLADVIPVPGLRQIVSLGDVLLTLGIGYLVHVRMSEHKRGKHSLERA